MPRYSIQSFDTCPRNNKRRLRHALQGACGYGYIKKNEWPYWSVGALTPGNRFAKAGPAHACGYAEKESPNC